MFHPKLHVPNTNLTNYVYNFILVFYVVIALGQYISFEDPSLYFVYFIIRSRALRGPTHKEKSPILSEASQ